MMGVASTIARPPARAIQAFQPDQAGADTVLTYLTKGYSLGICCKDCARLVEWTPHNLAERFGDRLGVRIADLAERLSCSGADGCGSRQIAVFPHLYDGDWRWPTVA